MTHPISSPLDVAPPRTATSNWTVFWIASVAAFLVSLDNTVLFAAFGVLRASFPGNSAAELSWVLNAYTVVYAALLIPAGGLADRHGRKRVFLWGVLLFLLASLACGLAESLIWLVGARVVQAVGAALLTPASLSIVLDAFPSSKRAVAVSIWGAVGALAAAVGPSIGSAIIDAFGWAWAFYINLPLGAASLWLGGRLLRDSTNQGKGRPLDLVGMVLVVIAVGAVTLAIVQSESDTWSRNALLIVGGTGVAAFLAFLRWASKVKQPLVDLALFRNRTYSAINLATLAFGIAFVMMFFGFFFFMTGVWQYSLPQAGLAITPGPLMVMPVAIIAGRLASRIGHRPILIVGSIIYAASAVWFLLVPGNEAAYLTHWLPGLFLSGTGVGMVLPSLTAAAVSHLPPEHYALGSAVNQAIRQIGTVIGVALTVLLLEASSSLASQFDPLYGTQTGLALATGLFCFVARPGRRAA